MTPLPMRRIVRTWWPLAASWMLMSVELPAITAVIARLANPEIHLAAYGSIVFPIALIIESPIIMLLAASTALSKDAPSYSRLRRFMMITSGSLTAVHILVAFTPIYDFVVTGILGAPSEIVEPARYSLMVMTPWTWSIAYRRFNQGLLIRFGPSRVVGLGTLVRLAANTGVLTAGYLIGVIPGAVVGATTAVAGVLSEAAYIGRRVRPVVQDQLLRAPIGEPALTFRSMMAFYVPLSMTSLIGLVAQPIGSAALGRMPLALASLAVWPVIAGMSFFLRSIGVAYNEVVVAMLDEQGAVPNLRRFMVLLATVTTIAWTLVVFSPVSRFWLERALALTPELSGLAESWLWLLLPLPALAVLQSWYQGILLHARQTRGITEAVVIFLVLNTVILWSGVAWGESSGLFVGLTAFTAGTVAQTLWLWHRSRSVVGG